MKITFFSKEFTIKLISRNISQVIQKFRKLHTVGVEITGILHTYSVGNLVLPHQNSYLVSGMGPNLVAHNFGFPQWILTSRVAIESLGYGVCCIRVWD